MKSILFVKYNSTRKPEYRIKTEIVADETDKYVIKTALESEANNHVANLADFARHINDVYADFVAEIPEIKNGNAAVYSYIEGESEEDKLKKLLGNKDMLLKELHIFMDSITELKAGKGSVFSVTGGFVDVFGNEQEYKCLEDLDAVSVANIDMIPENFIWNGNRLYCLDCEWVLEFPVPLEFIKYRSLFYFYRKFAKNIEVLLPVDEFWESFGILENRRNVYELMEKKFQDYINGENSSCRYTDRYVKPVCDFDTLIYRNQQFDVNSKRIVQLQDETNILENLMKLLKREMSELEH